MSLQDIQKKYKETIPVPIVKIATKDLKLKIYHTSSLNDNECGLIRKEGEKYVIYVNNSYSTVRKRFTIAHEVAHFLNNKDGIVANYVTYAMRTGTRNKKEGIANQVARNLLMPKDAFRKVFEESNSIEEVANKFEVPVSSATTRAEKLLKRVVI